MAGADEPCCGAMFWLDLMICVALVLFAGLMSGLTLGLMSLSLVDLEVLVKAGTPQDQLYAAKILPVVKNQHWLLCTLLIGNSLAMEALPIFLDALLPAWGAILISVTLILAFGEIIPQAICSRYGLKVGAKTAPIVRVLLIAFFPVAYPISKLLDWILGKGHFALMRRAELRTLVDMHGNEAGKGGELTHDETTIITGALDMTQKTVKDAMTPIDETFALDINDKLDMHTMGLIMTKGHSRVPIYSGNPRNIIGLILVKNLLTCRPEDEVPLKNVTIRKIPRVYDDLPLYDILNEFQKGHSHMAVVVKHTKSDSTEKNENSSSENQLQDGQSGIAGGSQTVFVQKNAAHSSSSPVGANFTESRGPMKLGALARSGDSRSQSRKEKGRRDDILDVNLEGLPTYSMEEEPVGIITMEDIMEELLQEEILDETDEYVDVHNKIKINMLPPKSSQSPGGHSPVAQALRRTPTPTQSPLSYYQSSVFRSPPSAHSQLPAPAPLAMFSPGKSPSRQAASGYSSPASNQVSRKEYEKLRKNGDINV